ncbi:MAG: hypothetical protein JXR94_07955 [Candidatus Hydrogenedentes bacterium]|nr:hypothetical protein [Candidatus Hydrogenedentota bacterium]
MRRVAGCRTGIVASVGRTFEDLDTIRAGIEAGARGFRLALGLADRDHARDFETVRAAAAQCGVDVDVLLDLPANRPRVGAMAARSFESGDRATVVDAPAAGGECEIPVPGLAAFVPHLAPGHRMWFRDGRQRFRIAEIDGRRVHVECEACAEPVQPGNGCSFPDSAVTFEAMRPSDGALLERLAAGGLSPEWVAASLVTSPAQVREVRAAAERIWPGRAVRVMAKIETAEAVAALDAIFDEADGGLLGRGDLALRVPVERLPRIQERVAAAAGRRDKPFAVATQILERFAETGEAYRAELSDVALGVRQGAAALVLCQETNDSPRPVESIQLMHRIIEMESLDENRC